MVTLRVYDMTGRLINTLVSGTQTAGRHRVTFDASNLSSGVYLYELRTENQARLGKMTLVK